MNRVLLLGSIALVGAIGCSGGSSTPPEGGGEQKIGKKASGAPETTASFANVSATLQANCVGCHGATNPKAGINMTSFETLMKGGEEGPVIVAGDPAASLLVKALRGQGAKQMPPKKDPLPEDQIKQIEDWIKAGAKQS